MVNTHSATDSEPPMARCTPGTLSSITATTLATIARMSRMSNPLPAGVSASKMTR